MVRTGTNYRSLERIVKGFANHRRLQILDLLKREPELSVDQISIGLRSGTKTPPTTSARWLSQAFC